MMSETTSVSQEVTDLELEVIDEAAAAQVSGGDIGWGVTPGSWPIMD